MVTVIQCVENNGNLWLQEGHLWSDECCCIGEKSRVRDSEKWVHALEECGFVGSVALPKGSSHVMNSMALQLSANARLMTLGKLKRAAALFTYNSLFELLKVVVC